MDDSGPPLLPPAAGRARLRRPTTRRPPDGQLRLPRSATARRGEAVAVDPAYGVRRAGRPRSAPTGCRLTGVLVDPLAPRPRRRRPDGLRHRGRRASCSARDDVGAGARAARRSRVGEARDRRCPTPTSSLHDSGDIVMVGDIPITLHAHARAHARAASASWSTAGSSPATRCSSTAAAAPTCPAATPTQMYESLTQRLATVPDDTVLYPGHLYSPEPSATMGETRGTQLRVPHPDARAVADAFRGDWARVSVRIDGRPSRLRRRRGLRPGARRVTLVVRYGQEDEHDGLAADELTPPHGTFLRRVARRDRSRVRRAPPHRRPRSARSSACTSCPDARRRGVATRPAHRARAHARRDRVRAPRSSRPAPPSPRR